MNITDVALLQSCRRPVGLQVHGLDNMRAQIVNRIKTGSPAAPTQSCRPVPWYKGSPSMQAVASPQM